MRYMESGNLKTENGKLKDMINTTVKDALKVNFNNPLISYLLSLTSKVLPLTIAVAGDIF